MKLYFNPIPKLTIAAALMFAALMSLGVWQIQRLHWKLNLIATVNSHLAAPPLSLDTALAMGTDAARYHRVALTGHFLNADESYLFRIGADGHPVYHVLTPFMLAGGKALMVDRGYIPLTLKNPASRAAGELTGTRRIVGVWRHDRRAGAVHARARSARTGSGSRGT